MEHQDVLSDTRERAVEESCGAIDQQFVSASRLSFASSRPACVFLRVRMLHIHMHPLFGVDMLGVSLLTFLCLLLIPWRIGTGSVAPTADYKTGLDRLQPACSARRLARHVHLAVAPTLISSCWVDSSQK